MGTLNDSGDSFPDILQFEQTDPVLSGEPNEATGAGLDNIPHLQLARRTRWLRTRVDQLLGAVVQATTNVAGLVRLNNTLTSTATDQAATADAVRRANAEALARVPATRVIGAAGLAVGGGALSVDRTITVPKATIPQAIAGLADDVALTPLTGRALVEDFVGGSDDGGLGLVPAGALMDFARQTAPDGWLICNGAEVPRAQYPALFAAIGTVWGTGNGSTTFNLPDLRGEFRRGWDAGRGVDPGRGFATAQSGAIQSHGHTGATNEAGTHAHALPFPQSSTQGGPTNGLVQGNGVGTGQTSAAGAHSHSVTIEPTGGPETRPRNIAVLTCIKT
jgi:microcystin-dependent protein